MVHEVAPTLGAAMGLGFVLGLKHATEADHVVAVSAIVTEHRSVWRSALVGAFWGIGHTVALLIAGLILLIARARVPASVAAALEVAVAGMIVLLGLGVLARMLRDKTIHAHAHKHDGVEHLHFHIHQKGHEHVHTHRHPGGPGPRWGAKALAVGIVHGLAGSGALTLLVMQRLPTIASGLMYIAVFGAGTVAGMLLMSGLVSVPLSVAAGRYGRVHRALCGLAGAGSVIFGLYYGCVAWFSA